MIRFRQDDIGGGVDAGAGAGDLIQALRRHRDKGRLRLDLFVDSGDIGIDAVDPGQQEGVVIISPERASRHGNIGQMTDFKGS